MKITNIELVSSTKPIILPAPWRLCCLEPDAKPDNRLFFSFYKVHTDEGIVGIGPTSPGNAVLPPASALSSLIGLDPAYIERFWDLHIPIAGGEHIANIYEFRDALFAKAYDIVQPDPILGHFGITGIRKVAVLADACGRSIVPHVCNGGNNGLYLAAVLQVSGSVGGCPFVEYVLDPPALVPEALHTILKTPIRIDSDGYVQIPQKPGLGIELDEEKIAAFL